MTGAGRPPARPWLAGVLGLVTVGLGHFYAGRPLRGVAAWAFVSALGIGVVTLLLDPLPYPPWSVIMPLAGLLVAWLLLIRDGILCARTPSPWRPAPWLVAGAVIAVAFADDMADDAVRTRLGRAFTISSGSMKPGLLVGDRILVDMRATAVATPRRGDVVVFRYPVERDKTWLKRIAGLPGETVEVRSKRLLVDGVEPTDLPAVYLDGDTTLTSTRDRMPARAVEPDRYFLIGDNRDRSYDSRFWGTVARDDLLGKARVIYFSWDPDASAVRWSRIGRELE